MDGCAVAGTVHLLGQKWAPVVLQEVSLNGEKGFNALYRRMRKVSPKILARRLKDLEALGIIERKEIKTARQNRTSYKLTQKGSDLNDILSKLRQWNSRYTPEAKECGNRNCVECPLYLEM